MNEELLLKQAWMQFRIDHVEVINRLNEQVAANWMLAVYILGGVFLVVLVLMIFRPRKHDPDGYLFALFSIAFLGIISFCVSFSDHTMSHMR